MGRHRTTRDGVREPDGYRAAEGVGRRRMREREREPPATWVLGDTLEDYAARARHRPVRGEATVLEVLEPPPSATAVPVLHGEYDVGLVVAQEVQVVVGELDLEVVGPEGGARRGRLGGEDGGGDLQRLRRPAGGGGTESEHDDADRRHLPGGP